MGSTDIVYAYAFSFQDILLVILIGLVLFGGKKLGDIGKGLGQGIRNFKDVMKGEDNEKKQ